MRGRARKMHVREARKGSYREAGSATQLFARARVLTSSREKNVRKSSRARARDSGRNFFLSLADGRPIGKQHRLSALHDGRVDVVEALVVGGAVSQHQFRSQANIHL